MTCNCGPTHDGMSRRDLLKLGIAGAGFIALGPFGRKVSFAAGTPVDQTRLVVMNLVEVFAMLIQGREQGLEQGNGIVQRESTSVTTALLAGLRPRVAHQDVTHHRRRQAEEVPTVFPLSRVAVNQLDERFVNQRGRL